MPHANRGLPLDDVVLLLVRVVTLGMGAVAAFAIGGIDSMAPSVVLLGLVAALASITSRTRLNGPWVPILESLAAGAVIGFGPDQADVLLPYLIAPVTSAGLRFGGWSAATATFASGLALAGAGTLREAAAEAQWFIVVLGAGLLAAWLRKTRLSSTPSSEQQAYLDAAQLLGELRTLTRPLAGGLDPRPLGAGLLADLGHEADLEDATVLLRVASDRRPVAQLGHPSLERAQSALVDSSGSRNVVPVTLDARDVAWVVVEHPHEIDAEAEARLRDIASRWALRLDAAALFEEVRELATRAERARLARAMHDGIAQDVASLGLLADDLLHMDPLEREDDLRLLRDRIGTLVSELRLSIHDLKDEGTSTGGLSAAVAEAARREAGAGGMAVHLRLADAPTMLSTDVETELFRIAQEALVNARRHAHAQNLWVSSHTGPGGVVVVIEDDGRGLGEGRGDSLGMTIMTERASRIGAKLSIRPRDGGGTIVEVDFAGESASTGRARSW